MSPQLKSFIDMLVTIHINPAVHFTETQTFKISSHQIGKRGISSYLQMQVIMLKLFLKNYFRLVMQTSLTLIGSGFTTTFQLGLRLMDLVVSPFTK